MTESPRMAAATAKRAPRSGIAWEGSATFVGVGLNAAISFVVMFLVARSAGAAGAGAFFLFNAIFAITTSIIGLGGDTAMVRVLSRQVALGRIADLRRTVLVGALPLLALGVGFSAALWLWGGALLRSTNSGLPPEAVGLLAAFVVPGAFLGVLLGAARGLGRPLAYTAVQNVSVPVLRVVAVATVVTFGGGVELLLLAWCVPVAIGAVVAVGVVLRALAMHGRGADGAPRTSVRTLAREYWSFALPRGGAVVLERAIDWSDVLLVIAILGPAAGGVYGVVSRCVTAGAMIEQALRIVLGPRVSAAIARADRGAILRLFDGATSTLIALAWPFYLGLVVFAPDVLSLFGPGFVDGANALRVLSLAFMIQTAAGMLQTFLLMEGRSIWQLFNRGIQWMVLVLGTVLAAPSLGIVGVAVAWFIAIIVDTALASIQVKHGLGISTRPRLVLRSGSPAVLVLGVAGGVLHAVLDGRGGTCAAALLLGSLLAVYAGLLWKFRRSMILWGPR